eukprot:6209975-Pleurochrysis_carterae.AAC.1
MLRQPQSTRRRRVLRRANSVQTAVGMQSPLLTYLLSSAHSHAHACATRWRGTAPDLDRARALYDSLALLVAARARLAGCRLHG